MNDTVEKDRKMDKIHESKDKSSPLIIQTWLSQPKDKSYHTKYKSQQPKGKL